MPTPPPLPPEWGGSNPPPAPPPLPQSPMPGEAAAPKGGVEQAPLDIQLPLTTGYVIVDTETGGLSEKANPLLSAAVVVADSQRREVDGFALRIRPPDGSLLEIPIPEHMGKGFDEVRKRKNQYYLDVYSGEKYTEPGDRWIITSAAAEINGYVTVKDYEYDLNPMHEWNKRLSLEEAEATFIRFISQFFTHKPVAVAHNAQFDQKFVRGHLPELYDNIMEPWFCTYKAFRKWKKEHGYGTGKGACTLETACKHAGYDLSNAHEALADTRGCLALLRWLDEVGFRSM